MTKRKSKKKAKAKKRKRQVKKQPQQINCHGFDYGIKPNTLSMFNPEFVDLWGKAQCIGVAYTIVPQLGLRIEVPTLGIAFDHYDIGIKVFQLFKQWIAPPCDASAINIVFAEYDKEHSYNMAIGVNPEQLILRTLGKDSNKDYEIITTSGFVVKNLPLSENYKQFKEYSQDKEVFVYPIKNVFPKNTQNFSSQKILFNADMLNIEHGFFKNDIKHLMGEGDSSSRESIYTILDKNKKAGQDDGKYERKIQMPDEVFLRREKQLRRFFPVLLIRLKHNKSFLKAKEQLNKYAEWQIIQAVCNLYAKGNWPEYGRGNKVDMIRIYQELRISVQDANEDAMLTFKFDVDSIEKQILFDMKYLHDNVCPNSKDNIKKELSSKGYL